MEGNPYTLRAFPIPTTNAGCYSLIYARNSVAEVGIAGFLGGIGGVAARWVQTPNTTVLTDLGLLPDAGGHNGPPSSFAYGLNTRGDVVGVSDTQYPAIVINSTQSVEHGFLWNNGVMTDLGTIAGNYYSSIAEGVNDSREIVGWTNTVSSVTGETLTRAFIYINGTMYNLSFFLVGGPTVLLSDATAIDCQGNISAIGTPAAGSSTHSYLLVRQGAARTACPK